MSKLYVGVDDDVTSADDVYIVRASNKFGALAKVIDQFARKQVKEDYFREYVESRYGCDFAENFRVDGIDDQMIIPVFEKNVHDFFENDVHADEYLYYYFDKNSKPNFSDGFYYEASKNLASKTENWVTFNIKEIEV